MFPSFYFLRPCLEYPLLRDGLDANDWRLGLYVPLSFALSIFTLSTFAASLLRLSILIPKTKKARHQVGPSY